MQPICSKVEKKMKSQNKEMEVKKRKEKENITDTTVEA